MSASQDSQYKRRLERWADDVSCALFSLANVVTIMYYIVDTSTNVRTLQPVPCTFVRLLGTTCFALGALLGFKDQDSDLGSRKRAHQARMMS